METLISCLSRAHARMAERAPLVQNITNTVVQQYSANVLLAVGASPAMLDHEADAAQFAAVADALLVNFGTATSHQFLAADMAVDAVTRLGKPWVLDPVSVGLVDFRSARIHRALGCGPTAVRGNASEIMALAGAGEGGRGVDAIDEVEAALPAAVDLARRTGSVVAVSGQRDAVVAVLGGEIHVARIAGGHRLMTRVVGTGCALGSLVAAYLGARDSTAPGRDPHDDFMAVVAAHAHFALAGAQAGQQARGPGSFAVAFLDALSGLASDDFAQAQVELQTHPLTSESP